MAGGRKKSGPKAAFVRFNDDQMSPTGHFPPHRGPAPKATPPRTGLATVRRIWEGICLHKLDPWRVLEFYQNPDAIRLADCTPALLRESAAIAKTGNPDGHLLLAEWWWATQMGAAESAT